MPLPDFSRFWGMTVHSGSINSPFSPALCTWPGFEVPDGDWLHVLMVFYGVWCEKNHGGCHPETVPLPMATMCLRISHSSLLSAIRLLIALYAAGCWPPSVLCSCSFLCLETNRKRANEHPRSQGIAFLLEANGAPALSIKWTVVHAFLVSIARTQL